MTAAAASPMMRREMARGCLPVVVVEAERLAAVGRRMVERAKAEVVAAGTVRVVAVVMQ